MCFNLLFSLFMRTMDKDCETTLHQYLKYY